MSKNKSLKQIKNKVKNSVTKEYFDNRITEEKKAEHKIIDNLNELNKKTLQPEELIIKIAETISKQNEERERTAKLKDQYNEQSDNCKTIIYWTCRIFIILLGFLSFLSSYSICCKITIPHSLVDLCSLIDKHIFELLFGAVDLFNIILSIIFLIKTCSYEYIFNKHKDIVKDYFINQDDLDTNNDMTFLRKIRSFIKSIACKLKSNNGIKKEISDVKDENAKARIKFNDNNIIMITVILSVYGIITLIAIKCGGIGNDTLVFFGELTFFLLVTVTLWLLVALTAATEEWSSASAYNFIALLVSVISFILAILSILQTATPKT